MIIEVACLQNFLGMDTSLALYRVNWLPNLSPQDPFHVV